MTVEEILEKYKGQYSSVEVYMDKNLPKYSKGFMGYGLENADEIYSKEKYLNAEVKDWNLMDKDWYEQTLWTDCGYPDLTFKDVFGSDDAKILVIILPYEWYESVIASRENIDMWYGDEFEPKKYFADAHFYPNECVFRGNIYDEKGKIVGDYNSSDSVWIAKNFKIRFLE